VQRASNSVLLVGPAGVGSTALCLGLQAMKGEESPPFDIVSKSLYFLDVDGLFSSGDPSEIDAAFRRALSRMQKSVEPVLIIEDAGDFVEACRIHGSSHFINSMNGMVSKGQLQVILETSDGDASKVLAWHSDIRESYTILDLAEPEGENLIDIVTDASARLQEYHGIKISEEAIKTAVDLTQKYRQAGSSAAQPKRSIELLDQSLAAYRLAAHAEPPKAKDLRLKIEAGQGSDTEVELLQQIMTTHAERQGKLRKLHTDQKAAEIEIVKIEEAIAELREAQAQKQEALPVQDAPAAPMSFASLTSAGGMGSREEQMLTERLVQFRNALRDHSVAYDAIAKDMNAELLLDENIVVSAFANISGIPAAKLGEDEKVILRELETNLKTFVFGQDFGVEKIANAIKVSKVGRRNKEKPLASFLLPGPSGVGKTEIAKQVAKQLLGDPKALTRFDMSEYMERHAVSKLIGAPPGYEGFEAGGILTNAMRINRNRVILFDEIEKAHPDVFNLFLQILDDGRLTDNIGRVADFSDAIIIMTTNIGQSHFLDEGIDHVEAMVGCMEEMDGIYRPEFLNRFNGRQNIIGFQRLEISSIERIIQREVNDLATSYAEHGVSISFPASEIAAFCADRYEPKVGARGLPGMINSDLEPRIVNALLDQSAESGAAFDVRYDSSTRSFAVEMMRAAA
ncbi:MAG: AAA family ATPase, partial [Roseibium sp.]|uniref:AAA family ATPase n=1 Tax=Roseibium sp. TaxID=1936156 RepID=UPI0032990B0A